MTRAEVVREVEEVRASLLRAWDRTPERWRDLPPRDGRWSPAQIIEHVALAHGSVVRVLEGLLSAAGSAGTAGEPPAAEQRPVASMERFGLLDRSRKAEAPELSQPSDTPDRDRVWKDLGDGTRDLVALLRRFWDQDLSSVVQRHPVLGRLNAYQWFRFVPLHELRHVAQLEEATGELRASHRALMTLPGVGKSIATDLMLLGFRDPAQLGGADPAEMFQRLQEVSGGPQDRCVLYVFRCAVYSVEADRPDPERLLWWRWKD